MREPTYYILASLLEGPRHGYGIIQRVAQISDRRIRLSAGTLYGALDRLTAEGLVEQDHDEIVGGRARRYYRLTGGGVEALRQEALRLQQAATIVILRLGGESGELPA